MNYRCLTQCIQMLQNGVHPQWRQEGGGYAVPVYEEPFQELTGWLQQNGLWDERCGYNINHTPFTAATIDDLTPHQALTVLTYILEHETHWPGLMASSMENGFLLHLLQLILDAAQRWEREPMNILVTLDRNYLPPLQTMLRSMMRSNPGNRFELYILHSSLTDEDIRCLEQALPARCHIHSVVADGSALEDAPVTDRYPKEMYYRIFAAKYLPETLSKVLYLDPDMIINRSLEPLYQTDLSGYLFAAASHVKGAMQKINELRLDMEESGPYINSGVMLMNLSNLRKLQNYNQVFDYIRQHKNLLILPDQDVISGLYASSILRLDPYRFNMTERILTLHWDSEAWMNVEWVRKNSVIIHYCGRNKPWKENYRGRLNVFYDEEIGNSSVPL